MTSLQEEEGDDAVLVVGGEDGDRADFEDVDEDEPFLPDVSDVEHLRVVLRLTSFCEESDHESLKQVGFYYIHVCAEGLGGRVWYIRKRYSDFTALRKELEKIVRHPPTLPGKDVMKRIFGMMDLRVRANGLSTFLWRVAADPQLRDSTPVRNFLLSNLVHMPPANVHPTTPLISSLTSNAGRGVGGIFRQNSASLATVDNTQSFKLDSGGSSSRNLLKRRQSEGSTLDSAGDDLASDDGRLYLGKGATDIQRGFEDEGLAFAEADMMGHHGEESFLSSSSTNAFERCNLFGSSCRSNNTQNFVSTAGSVPMVAMDSASSTGSWDDSTQWSTGPDPFPALRVVIMLVGSRGDVQPYVALGKALKGRGHQVRIAAHSCFREWVEVKHGLEFAPIAGDPKELLRMVVENKMFSFSFVKNGLTNHRAWVSQVLDDCWNACTQEDPYNIKVPMRKHSHLVGPGHAFTALDSKYRADLIIANPPCFAGWHCAEALGIPLLMTFPMPWSRTTEFPSPFTSLSALTSPASMNWMSYGAVDRLIWLGLGDLINAFRVQVLSLPPIWTLSVKGHRYIHDYRVPWLYPWSPSVLKQPHDWGDHILVSGYLFLDDSDGADWQPDEILRKCFGLDSPLFSDTQTINVSQVEEKSNGSQILEKGHGKGDGQKQYTAMGLEGSNNGKEDFYEETSKSHMEDEERALAMMRTEGDRNRVVFIGFGSIVVKDPERLSDLILTAASVLVEKGFKVLVQRGWAGVEFPPERIPKDGVYLIGPAPHSWIFARCCIVVHHGGSGTTAEGLRLGVPTVIVPFFGDQFFWGETVLRKGLGDYEPYVSLTPLRLVECILNCAQAGVKERCLAVSRGIRNEDGAKTASDFVERYVFGFDGFEALVEEESQDWRKYPYYDLKKRIKNKRYENVKGFRKVKSRVKSLRNLLSSTASTTQLPIINNSNHNQRSEKVIPVELYANGVEMNRVAPLKAAKSAPGHLQRIQVGSSTSKNSQATNDLGQLSPRPDFPYMPEIYPGRIPEGHTAFSWFGKRMTRRGFEDLEIPPGHTAYTWMGATW